MKLNFWQILGVILLIAGGAWWFYQHNHPKEVPVIPKPATTAVTTQPK